MTDSSFIEGRTGLRGGRKRGLQRRLVNRTDLVDDCDRTVRFEREGSWIVERVIHEVRTEGTD